MHFRFPSIKGPVTSNFAYNGHHINFPEKRNFNLVGGEKVVDGELNAAVVDWFLRRYGEPEGWFLDIGFGTGTGAIAAAFFGANSAGIDISETAVIFCVSMTC